MMRSFANRVFCSSTRQWLMRRSPLEMEARTLWFGLRKVKARAMITEMKKLVATQSDGQTKRETSNFTVKGNFSRLVSYIANLTRRVFALQKH